MASLPTSTRSCPVRSVISWRRLLPEWMQKAAQFKVVR